MSRRTAEADKAIRAAWERERELVNNGQGTRDWTPKHQADILERGKAYDDDGKAFHGQHMKSVAKYPQFQGDPDNIQFLTKEEHLEAHQGSWQNPTNWYYDPVTKDFFDFGDGKYIPCKIINLSEPIVSPKPVEEKPKNVPTETPLNGDSKRESSPPPSNRIRAAKLEQKLPPPPKSKIVNSIKKLRNRLGESAGNLLKYVAQHPFKAAIAVLATAACIHEVTTAGSDTSGSSSSNVGVDCSSSGENNNRYLYVEEGHLESYDSEDSVFDEDISKAPRKSPVEHIVNDPGQRYHYKDGSTRFVEKKPYKRGVPKSEE